MIRKVESGTIDYSYHYVMQHDLLRDLAIHQTSQEPEAQRDRLIIDISGNNLPEWWNVENEYQIKARILSISTGLFISVLMHTLVERLLCH